jgi:branched-subunit amino acid transport protein
MNLWLIVLGMGAASFSIRLSMLVFVHHSALPPAFREALRFVTPAIFAAIIAMEVLYPGSEEHFDAGIRNERLLAALLAAAVAWATNNVWLTIGVGMSALWALQWLA